MNKNVYETRVIFKMDGENCIAFLLNVPANPGNLMSYAHVGQHGEASLGYFYELPLATEEQFKDLHEELESIGYRLYVRCRLQPSGKNEF